MKGLWLAGALLALPACATPSLDPPAAAHMASADPRQSVELREGWEFQFHDGWSVEEAIASPPTEWATVSLPHSWNRLGEYRVGRSDATDNRQGTGWYRRTLDGTALDPAQRHFLEFDAVGNVADVWLNGRHIGSHSGAFTRFRIEVTQALDYSGPNQLLVRADNSDPQPGSTTADVIPLLGDFFIHGGIYRPARLLSVGQSHIALDDFGGPGVYATPRILDGGIGQVDVLARLSGAAEGQAVTLNLMDAQGRAVSHARQAVRPGQREVSLSLNVIAPRVWNGRSDPYLYRLIAKVEGRGTVIDRVEQTIGFRSIRFDPDQGFFLNGNHLPLRGVSRHQDMLGQGWVLAQADEDRDMALITEMGANSVRVAHYPQSTHWFDLADRHGMVAWAEVPFVNKPSFDNSPATPQLIANARQQLIEMIRQYFNHPSIVTWGIGNEVDIDLAFKRLGPEADARPLLRDLNALAHSEDPSRPTVLADCCEATPGEKAEYLPTLSGEADLMGYNRYFGWYYGDVADLGPHMDMLHERYPALPLSISEYGAGGALSQHSADPQGRPTNITGRPQPEEFQAWWHEQSWPQIRSRNYLWGSWIWNMFDFSSRVRQEGDATDINTKGLVSFDRAVKKDAFYYYKAQWSEEPVVHITSRRFRTRSDPSVRIKVYSNAPRVRLALNGTDLGEAACEDRICIKEGVTLAVGVNRIEATALFDGRPVGDHAEWMLADGN